MITDKAARYKYNVPIYKILKSIIHMEFLNNYVSTFQLSVRKKTKITLHWLLMALHLSAAEPSLKKKEAASEYLSNGQRWGRIVRRSC